MRIWLRKKLHAARLVQFHKLVENLRSVELQLFHANTGKRECYAKVLPVLFDHLPYRVEGGDIGTLGYVADGTLVLIVVIIVVIGAYVEETITFQMHDLMYLEI